MRLRAGIVLLIVTPWARVVVVTVGLALERELAFTVVSLFRARRARLGIWVAVHR